MAHGYNYDLHLHFFKKMQNRRNKTVTNPQAVCRSQPMCMLLELTEAVASTNYGFEICISFHGSTGRKSIFLVGKLTACVTLSMFYRNNQHCQHEI